MNGTTPGADEIPVELYKSLGTAFKAFHEILVSIWEEECMSADFRDATIATLYKNKETKSDCGNYRGISLLFIAGKILAQIFLNRLITSVSESNLPEAQCGFRHGRNAIDTMFAVRQVKEKCIKQQTDLFSVFKDLTKALDTVNRDALWTILAKVGCPCQFTVLVRLFRSNSLKWWLHQLLQHLQWRETRLRTRPSLVQLVLFASATPHSGPRPGRVRQISFRRLCLWPPQTLCRNQDGGKNYHWSSICGWLCPHGTQGILPADHCRSLCRLIKVLWIVHQLLGKRKS